MPDASTTHKKEPASFGDITVALVGLGRIGFQNDSLRHSPIPLTHLACLSEYKNVSVVLGIDKDNSICRKFQEITGIETLSDLDEIKRAVDLLVISAPTESHLDLISSLSKRLSPRIVVCEKPLGINLRDAEEIVAISEKNNFQLFVPYTRRYLSQCKLFANLITSKIYGEICEVSVEYGQGLLINGSHFVNLADFLLTGLGSEVANLSDTNSKNPSWTSRIQNNGAPVYFKGTNAKTRSGEIRIKCERGEFVLSHGGIIAYHGEVNPKSGWLEKPLDFQVNEWRVGMRSFYGHLMDRSLENRLKYKSDLDSAIRTQKIITKVLG